MTDTAAADADAASPPARRQAAALIAVAAAILVAGFTPYAFVGLLAALAIVLASIRRERPRAAAVGLRRPSSWIGIIAVATLVGIGVQLFSLVVLAPVLKALGSDPLDLSALDQLRGNAATLVILLLYVWLFVALVEEVVFRGFLLPRLAALLGPARHGTAVAVVLTSILFGLAHAYQGAPGIVLTGLTGAVLGTLFVRAGGNLWMPIVCHGVIDTVGILILYFGADAWLPSL